MKTFKITVTKTFEAEIFVKEESIEIVMDKMAEDHYDNEVNDAIEFQWNVIDSDYEIERTK